MNQGKSGSSLKQAQIIPCASPEAQGKNIETNRPVGLGGPLPARRGREGRNTIGGWALKKNCEISRTFEKENHVQVGKTAESFLFRVPKSKGGGD